MKAVIPSPTKTEEIAILRDAVERLGSLSYCGPWLNGEIPILEGILRSDYLPEITVADAQRTCAELVADAERRAKDTLDRAEREAKQIVEAARQEANRIRGDLASAIRMAEKNLGA